MDMVPNIDPLFNLISEQFLFFSAGNFLASFMVEDWVFLSENGVGGGVQSEEWIFLEQGAICWFATGLELMDSFTEEVLFMPFFLAWVLNWGS